MSIPYAKGDRGPVKAAERIETILQLDFDNNCEQEFENQLRYLKREVEKGFRIPSGCPRTFRLIYGS